MEAIDLLREILNEGILFVEKIGESAVNALPVFGQFMRHPFFQAVCNGLEFFIKRRLRIQCVFHA